MKRCEKHGFEYPDGMDCIQCAADLTRFARIAEAGEKIIDSPVRVGFSRNELFDAAKAFMIGMYGPPRASSDKDKWMERFGLLIHFATRLFDGEIGNSKTDGPA